MKHFAVPDLFTHRTVVLLGVTEEQLLPHEVTILRTCTTEDFLPLVINEKPLDPRSFKYWFYGCEYPESLTIFIVPDERGLVAFTPILRDALKKKAQIIARVGGRLAKVSSLFTRIVYQYLAPP
jgi:hypothetical protein